MADVQWKIGFATIRSPRSVNWIDDVAYFPSDESFYRSWDDNKRWDSPMIVINWIKRGNELVWTAPTRSSIGIRKVDNFREVPGKFAFHKEVG
jgi:hypothetical protein